MNNPIKSGIRISAVTITKNEEQNIGCWLQSVKHYADEIIVVDTGSTDNTVAIAEAAGAKVAYFPWVNDFAAAKNYALEQATGQWIAFFDTDEYYSDEDAKKVRPLLEQLNPRLRTIGVMQKLLNIDKDKHNRLISISYQLRLFRRLPDIKYQGKIHEGLTGIKEKRRDIFMDEDLHILHTGYSSSLNKQKTERNLKILLDEIEKRGHQPGDDYYLSDCYYSLSNYDKAIEHAQKHISSGEMIAGDETSIHINLINSRYLLNQPTSTILPDAARAIKTFPNSAVFHFLLGLSYFRENDYISASRWIDEGLVIWENRNNNVTTNPTEKLTGANNGETILPGAYYVRGIIHENSGDIKKAVKFIRASLNEYPYNSLYLTALLRLLTLLKTPAERIAVELQSLYDNDDASNAFNICEVLQPMLNRYPVLTDVYLQYAVTAGCFKTSSALRLAKGEYTLTAQRAVQELNTACCFGITAALKLRNRQNTSPISLYATEPLKEAWWYLDRGEPIPAKLFSAQGVKELAEIARNT